MKKKICCSAPEHRTASLKIEPMYQDGRGVGGEEVAHSEPDQFEQLVAQLPRAAVDYEPGKTAKPLSHVKSGISEKFRAF